MTAVWSESVDDANVLMLVHVLILVYVPFVGVPVCHDEHAHHMGKTRALSRGRTGRQQHERRFRDGRRAVPPAELRRLGKHGGGSPSRGPGRGRGLARPRRRPQAHPPPPLGHAGGDPHRPEGGGAVRARGAHHASADHPNLPRTIDGGVDETNGDLPFLAMEFLDGHPLADLVAEEGAASGVLGRRPRGADRRWPGRRSRCRRGPPGPQTPQRDAAPAVAPSKSSTSAWAGLSTIPTAPS